MHYGRENTRTLLGKELKQTRCCSGAIHKMFSGSPGDSVKLEYGIAVPTSGVSHSTLQKIAAE